jgi:rhodanese-related sulfurtransferase
MTLSDETYAGEVTVKQAWDMLSENPKARLVDVRTEAEFKWVGTPDLSGLGKEAAQVQWKTYPDMEPNPDFTAQVTGHAPDKNAPLLFICRSGGRSRYAAKAMTAAGYTQCFNVAGGFEGDPDEYDHRGTTNGWKTDGLPWKQT